MEYDLLSGIVRLALPLFCVVLAATWFSRIGIINIALDGQIGVGSIAYVAAMHYVPPLPAICMSFALVSLISYLLVEAKNLFRLDPLLVGLGLLYVCYGTAPALSHLFFGTAGYAQLGESLFGEMATLWLMVGISITAWLSMATLRPIRVAKVIEEAPELAEIQGLSVRWWSHVHGIVASLLVTAAAVYLTEHGGSFTIGISGERGFLALAFVAVSRHRVSMALGLSFLFGALQKLAYEGKWPIELFEAATFALAICLVIWSGARARRNSLSGAW